MRDYGKVATVIFLDPKSAQWDNDVFRLAIYLLAGPHTSKTGVFRLPIGYVLEDLGKAFSANPYITLPEGLRNPSETLSIAFRYLELDSFIRYCPETSYVWIINFLKYNEFDNPNVAKSALAELKKVPNNCCFLPEMIETIRHLGKWEWAKKNLYDLEIPKNYRNPSETLSKPFRIPEPSLSRSQASREPEPEPEPEFADAHQKTLADARTKKPASKKIASAKPEPSVPNLNQKAWADWIQHRKITKKPPYRSDRMAKSLANLPHDKQQECVEFSMTREYHGLCIDKFTGESNSESASQAWDEICLMAADPNLPKPTDPTILKVVQDLGGFNHLGRTPYSQLKFMRHDFIKRFLKESKTPQ